MNKDERKFLANSRAVSVKSNNRRRNIDGSISIYIRVYVIFGGEGSGKVGLHLTTQYCRRIRLRGAVMDFLSHTSLSQNALVVQALGQFGIDPQEARVVL